MLKLTQLTPSRANTVVLINSDCLGGALSLDELRQLASDAFRRELWAILEEVDTEGHCKPGTEPALSQSKGPKRCNGVGSG